MKTFLKYGLMSVLLLAMTPAFAQDATTQPCDPERLAYFQESGMIVFYVLCILFLGLFIFMFATERRLAKLEKEVNS